MSDTKHIVKLWRGKRATYNALVRDGKADYWTRYSIVEPDGSVTEVYGNKRIINEPSGQLLPVIDVVAKLSDIVSPSEGERYLVGHDATAENPVASYMIYTISLKDGEISEDNSKVEPFTRNLSVRIVNRFMKCYQLVEGELITYDDVNCGTF